jgi:ribosomal protein S18 acetylase RimI-like enzyme
MRGQGIGQALLRAVLARATELGAARVFLRTRRELAAAVRLYERAGFRHVDRASLPGADPRADTFMQHDLGRSQ